MSLVKNFPTLWRETEEENWTRINWWLLEEKYWWKVVNEKPLDPRGVLGGKLMPYDWGLKSWGSRDFERSFDEGWMEVMCSYVQSHAVTCIAAENIKRGSYPNLFKNMIKFKRSSVRFSLFVSAVGWSSLSLFGRSSQFDCWSSHRWCGVNSRWSYGWLVRIVFVEWADKLSKVLDYWSWLPGILFLWISFPWDQIVEIW